MRPITLLKRCPRRPEETLLIKYDAARQRNAPQRILQAVVAVVLAVSVLPAAMADALPLPRFASLKADEVYMRAGPGQTYPVNWVYVRKDLPVEITREDEAWRYVRDIEGTEGWIHRVMLSGTRTVIVTGDAMATAYHRPDPGSRPVFHAEPGVMGRFLTCEGAWCRIEVHDRKGWIPVSALWGVHPRDSEQ